MQMKLTPEIEMDMDAVVVLLKLLKGINETPSMLLHEMVTNVANAVREPLARSQMSAFNRLERDYRETCSRKGLEQPQMLMDTDGFLTPLFRTFLQLSVSGKFPGYDVHPPTSRTGGK